MSERYQDEIEELLKDIEKEKPAGAPQSGGQLSGQLVVDDLSARRSAPALAQAEPGQRGFVGPSFWRWLTPGKVALAGLSLLLLGFLLRSVGFGWLIWPGLLGLAAAYLLFFVRPRPVNRGKMWRGRSIETPSSSPWRKFKRWFGG